MRQHAKQKSMLLWLHLNKLRLETRHDLENTMKFCPECGTNVEGMRFCPECGQSLEILTEPAEINFETKTLLPKSTNVSPKRTDKVGPVEIDRVNKYYRIHGARKVANKTGIVKGTGKAVLAISTMGLSLMFDKDKNDTIWHPFSDLVSYDLIINNNTVATGGVGMALIGGIAFGGLGLVAGAITGKRKNTTRIEHMTIRVTSNDFSSPVSMIDIIRKPVKNTSKDYKQAVETAQKILGILDVIAHNAD